MIITLLLTLSLFQLPEPVVFDTVVAKVTLTKIVLAWECPDAPGNLCGEVIPVELLGSGSFRYWPKKVVRGQLLKATFFVGNLKSIPSCNERLAEAAKEQTQGLVMQTPTNSLMPPDCARQPSAFTRKLLEKFGPKDPPRLNVQE